MPISSAIHDQPAHCIVFFDGDCGLCSRFVHWLHAIDADDRFRFAPLHGETFSHYSLASATDPQTVILLRLCDLRQFHKSSACAECLRTIGGWASCCAVLYSAIPRFLRDALYDVIARHRRRFFAPQSACKMPDPRLQKKLLP